MDLNKLVARSKKRVGRGIGSGKGKTSGKGMKGQKARGKVSVGFIGGTLPIYKKLPFRRGLGNPKRSPKLLPISLSSLNIFSKGETVNMQTLVERGLMSESKAKKIGAKIMGEGEIDKPLTVELPATKSAIEKIEKVGGKVVRD